MKKKTMYIIILLLLITIVIVGTTYAFFVSNATSEPLETTGSKFEVLYTGGTHIKGPIKVISREDRELRNSTSVNISMAKGSVGAKATLYINIENITQNIAIEGFIWEVEGYQEGKLVYENNGTFAGTTNGDKIDIVKNYLLSEKNTTFNIYFWIDGNQTDNSILNSSFNGYIGASTEHFSGTLK